MNNGYDYIYVCDVREKGDRNEISVPPLLDLDVCELKWKFNGANMKNDQDLFFCFVCVCLPVGIVLTKGT